MTHLDTLLDSIGYTHRAEQDRLYEALTYADNRGVVVQAGTGVGKSIAVLAAAARAFEQTGNQSLIVTPTRVLMDQYMAKDVPNAAKAFGLDFTELRGRAHYWCERSKFRADMLNVPYDVGCWGEDVNCTGTSDDGMACEYQGAKMAAREADVVVTNTDFWMINDRLLAPNGAEIFNPTGALFVDEAHQLDAKMRDYAARSMSAQRLKRMQVAKGACMEIADWIERQGEGRLLQESPNFPVKALVALASVNLPDKVGKATRETHKAAVDIVARMRKPIEACVIHCSEGAIKMEWTSVAAAAGATLSARPFALVSATIPKSMTKTLGIPQARFLDVGHPFDYAKQATLKISSAKGDFASRSKENFAARMNDVLNTIEMGDDGGTLVLVNSRKDCEFLGEYLGRKLMHHEVRAQTDEQWTNEELTDWFKAWEPGIRPRVLVGMESFKTGFDVPGDALKNVVIWALPYPGQDPVTKQIAAKDFRRYDDMMRVSAVQGIGRLIRTTEDRGHVLIADARGERLLDPKDPLTAHLCDLRRV